MKQPTKIAAVIVIFAILVCSVIITVSRRNSPPVMSDKAANKLLNEVLDRVEKEYVEKPDRPKLIKNMIDGMLATLDPHSAYLPPEPYKEMEVQISGTFGGVGIELGMKDGKLTVIAPIEGTPAFRAGIQPNDHIARIDTTSTANISITAAVKKMRGEKGTSVTLTIMRGEGSRPLVIPLIRDIILIKSIKAMMIEPGYGYLKISSFQTRTAADFRKELDTLHAAAPEGLKGLILDLRFNPGGLIDPAVQIANFFIGDDLQKTRIVSVKGRMPGANQDLHAVVGEKEPHYPLIVLINGGSASASEILAGALQDQQRAIVMGKQSFGKGSVQSILPLPNRAALKLTTGLYYTPSGRSIQAKGISPDVEVGVSPPVSQETYSGSRKKPAEKAASPHISPRDIDPVHDYPIRRALDLIKELRVVKDLMSR